MGIADYDIYRRVVAEIEHELSSEKPDIYMLQAIDKVIKRLREYESGIVTINGGQSGQSV